MLVSNIDTRVATFAKEFANSLEFPTDAFQNLLISELFSDSFTEKNTPTIILESLIDSHRDAWYHALGTFKNICSVLQKTDIPSHETHLVRAHRAVQNSGVSEELCLRRVFLLLDKMKRPTDQLLSLPMLVEVFGEKKLGQYRLVFKSCWTEFLRCSNLLGKPILMKLLRGIPESVMPHISNPETIFSSFFSQCFSQQKDGEVALLAVSGLFQLISRYNLGEPTDLYSRLYILLCPEVLESSRSNRVFQLLLKALKSDFMPNQYIPVFAKKMIQLATLVISPSLSLWLVVAAFNLMQAHPLVARSLVHREGPSMDKDLFDVASTDLSAMTKIIKSISLWEIELLLNHSDPSVCRMAGLFKTNFFARKAKRISSDDYLLITDEQLFNREKKYGSHSKNKKTRGDVELENLVGKDTRQEFQIPIAIGVHR